MEPPGGRPGRGRASKEASLRDSRGPSRAPSKGALGAHSGTSMEGEDWDAMVKSFLKAEIERTEQRQDWLRQKLEAAKELADEDTRAAGYQARAWRLRAARPQAVARLGTGVARGARALAARAPRRAGLRRLPNRPAVLPAAALTRGALPRCAVWRRRSERGAVVDVFRL